MRHDEGHFRGAGGADLFYQSFAPDEAPRAVIAVVHGLGEHSGRYGTFVDHFVPRGYAILGFDHRGHGRSPGPRGHVSAWSEFREDVGAFLSLARERFPGIPRFLFGHSMGGLIALNYALHDPTGLRGLILSAPGLDSSGLSPVTLALAKVLSRIAPALQLPTGLEAAGISRDPAAVAAYEADPLVHDRGTPRAATEGLAAIRWTLAHAADLRLPLLLYYGTADRLVPPAAARQFFEQVTFPDKTLHEYEGSYHETHNDLDRARLLADLDAWLDAHL